MSEVRLIDANEADKILTELRKEIHETGNVYGISGTIVKSVRACVAGGVRVAQANLNRMPTIEAEPVRHAQWEDCSNGWMCSECTTDSKKDYNFCPNCGAKMDGKPTDNLLEVTEDAGTD